MTTEPTYIAALCPTDAEFPAFLRKVAFATRENPDDICGVALQVGRAGTGKSDPPIYRLKLKASLGLKSLVLPGFFVLNRGVFIPCEQWKRHRKR